MNGFRKLPLCAAIGMLTLAMATSAATEEGKSEKKSKGKAGSSIEEIVVTGTLISRPTMTDMAPVTVIDSEQMAERGLLSLGDVMQSFTENTGYSEGRASNLLGRFTTGAEEVNMRGMGAGRTLVLVNGRRIADYPLPFGGEQNGVDFGAIPFAAISRVDYLSSGASATYGSDAVGGVINLITKRDMEQTTASVTTGLYEDGYGQMVDASIVTGNSFERGSFTVGAELQSNEDIMASEVDYLGDHAPFNATMVSLAENSIDGYNPIPVAAQSCAALGYVHEVGTCGQELSDTISVSPEIEQYSGFFDGRFDLTDQIELFGTGMLTANTVTTRSQLLSWDGVVVNEDGSAATFVSRGFSSAELGTQDVDDDQLMWTGTVGAKGGFEFGDDTWYWDLSYSHASYEMDTTVMNLKEEGVRDWILDGAAMVDETIDQQYTYLVDSDFYANRLVDNVLRPVASQDLDAMIGENKTHAESSADSIQLIFNGTLGDMKIFQGPVKFALLTEYATQSTNIDPDARSQDTTGHGWYQQGSIASDGERDREAVALEFAIPALANLDLSLAGRYDHYQDDSDIAGRFTGQAKFLYRATDWLKVRGNYSQIFRAPDMFNIYGSSDTTEFVGDFLAPGCYDGETYSCGYSAVATTRQGDEGLTEEHGQDLGIGLIWTPVTNFVVTADFYDIVLKDLVITQPTQDLLAKEWQCENGQLDGDSQLCADIHNRVIRDQFGAIERVIESPINQDELERQGLDIMAQLSFEFEDLGAFSASVSHTKVLDFELTRFSGDESLDLRYGEQGQSQPENISSAALTWYNPLSTGRAVSMGLFALRYGNVYNYSHTQFMDPMYSMNFVAGYQMNAKTQLRLSINNLLDEQPDSNDGGLWPNYWAHLQTGNALGRSGYLTLNYSFN